MKNRWSDREAKESVSLGSAVWGEPLALRVYSGRLLGADPDLVLHGGGNTSVKTTRRSRLGNTIEVLYVKASGGDLATAGPEGYVGLDLEPLCALRELSELADEGMLEEIERHRFGPQRAAPSLETLVHAFLPYRFIDHTHADAVLAITNQRDGARLVGEALGDEVLVIPYVRPGFDLARAVVEALDGSPGARGMVWMHHGLVTWGGDARESYEATIDLVTRAENFLGDRSTRFIAVPARVPETALTARLDLAAPIVRGLLARRTEDPDRPWRRVVVRPLSTEAIVHLLSTSGARERLLSPPLTTDHLIRTKALPVWIDSPAWDDPEVLRGQLARAIAAYAESYEAYLARHRARMPDGVAPSDPQPRIVLLPGLGALCAGEDAREAGICRDIAEHTLLAKARLGAGDLYEGLGEEILFEMEYRPWQRAKLRRGGPAPLQREVAIVTGAAGAIGSGICRELLGAGAHVVATDLPGERLDSLAAELAEGSADRVLGVALDVSDPRSVEEGFARAAREWGGVDLLVINAGVAYASALAGIEIEEFRRLERVNVEGTLLLLGEAARHFERQRTGGDIVVVSTKNVFAPGAGFGAYSATKAGAHQLARIASLELAPLDVRVNMVAPDAVFSEGSRRSGLWAEVGPERMRARGLDERGLEEYYRNRNLLKARVTARHVGKAVLFFATRQTPTTGATIPVDGGLPDATPR